MKLPIYLDYSATTPVDIRVAEKMMQYLTIDGIFGNPSSRSHRYGWQAEESVDIARNHIAKLVGADSREIIFTSGATESINLAIKGALYANTKYRRHIVTSLTEHKSVLNSCEYLKKQGFKVTYLTPQKDGTITIRQLNNAIRKNTLLVSIMHVNNEIGIIQNISEIGELCSRKNVLFHVDASQSIGKIFIDLSKLSIDLMSFSSHKVYGPKGIGALYIRRNPKVYINAQIHGGGHEYGIRSGTLPVHQIVGMGEAFRIVSQEMKQEVPRIFSLRDRLWKGLREIKDTAINGPIEGGVSSLLNVRFRNIDSRLLIISLKNIAVSSGSTCNSNGIEPSYVLKAIGLSNKSAYSSIRFSIGRFTTEEEIDYTICYVQDTIYRLRKTS